MKMRNIHSTSCALEITFPSTVRGLRKLALLAVTALGLQNAVKAEAGPTNKNLFPNPSEILKYPINVNQKMAKTITGLVTDETGLPLPGATIVAKGTTAKTVTGSDGKFTLNVPDNVTTLVVSYIGMDAQEVNISGLTNVTVKLKPSGNANLTEVVVTALGVKREKRALTFAAQQLAGTELTKAGSPNFMEALSGKAAGIDIGISNSGVGGSTKTVLRGSKSITGNSEALFVIDGVPVVNNKGGQPGSYGGTDGGDGLSALNQDDFESVTILRGANGSILYGSQGANGVILINTKKGQNGKIAIALNSTINFSNAATLPEFQFDYGAVAGSDYSWSKTKGSYQNNYIEDFFQTGVNTINSVSVSGGNERTTAYFSYGNNNASGIVPTSTYNKHNVTFSQETKLFDDKLTLSGNVRFSYEKSKNRPGAGYYNNPLTGLYLFARERNFDDYKTNYQIFSTTRNLYTQNWYSTEEKQNNPYWELNNDPKLSTSNRVIATAKASYAFLPHFKFDVRGNIDYNDRLLDYRYAAGGNSVSVSPNGTWNYAKYNDKALYSDAILSYDNTFGKFSLNSVLGASIQDYTFNDGMTFANGTVPLQYPNFFSFANLPYNLVINQTYSRIQKQGVFANASLGFKDMIYIDLSGRNDWASTLATTGNDSYFYYSGGLSAIISQMVTMPKEINFLKLRASTSQVGNEVPYNIVNPGNTIGGAGGPSGIGGITRNTQTPFATLVPEKITSNEIGLEGRFLNDRLSLDFTYYKNNSTNQFLSLPAPSGSGYTFYYVNAGKVTNQGFELTLGGDPVKGENFRWNTSVNLSRNRNKIVELIADNPGYQVGSDSEGFNSIIKAGGSFNDLYIFKFARNAAGQIILDAAGKPTKAATQEYVGNLNPNFITGWNNTFTYKNLTLSALVTAKFGGVAFSKTEAFLDSYGVSKRTGDARDAGTIPINAIQGNAPQTSIDPALYYSVIGDRNGIMEPYVFSRTNVRLAQVSLAYNLPVKGSAIKSASVSLIARNLFFFYKKAPFDPEQAMSTNNSMQANDVFAVPGTRSYGLNLKLNF
ncbi:MULTISPECIES: SusC/RagA family TonB-linked outer membrane protein [unclassified Pedobacter]|uniref:SusC/RagA family TonB-linked outer membrane protein n=1 Tax=unclassified Pedobacter TaxID=2628915 RepID=UPI001E618F02|nr:MULTISPECIES: SusC/RagA family TonB-linked outer membrane protein [unclassified Pedobacter]